MAGQYNIPLKHIATPGPSSNNNIFLRLIHPLIQGIKVLCGCAKVLWCFSRFRPQFVFSSGSFVSIPVLLGCMILGIPFFIHEQNVVLGRTNKVFRRFAKGMFFSWDHPELESDQNHQYVCGLPLRKLTQPSDRFDPTKRCFPQSKQVTLLVVGGSQGARALNSLVCDALVYFQKDPEYDFRFIHVTGMPDYQRVKDFYDHARCSGHIVDFCDDVRDLYQKSDLVIARAGASTLAEINSWALPSILIPIKHSLGDHQMKNALWQKKHKAAEVLEYDALEGRVLYETVRRILDDPPLYQSMARQSYKLCHKNAAQNIVKHILKIMDQDAGQK